MHLRTLALATVLAGAAHAWAQPAGPEASAPAAAAQTTAPQSAAIGSFAAMDSNNGAAPDREPGEIEPPLPRVCGQG